MRRLFLGAAGLAALGAVGCGSTTTSFVKSETTLGRVVVYRNGVAYFERTADVQGDSLQLNVPQDKVDDFLKSLTVVDATTGEPAPVSYGAGGSSGMIDMKVGLGKAGATSRKLRLSYVTEAPSWKPSYRVVVGKTGQVELQGWAIVDNTSGEDWKDVKLGVGASSAMSFRFDLKGLRLVDRETLHDTDLFAQAPPMGGASYGQQNSPNNQRIVADISDAVLASAANAAVRREETKRTQRPSMGKPGPRPMSKSGAPAAAADADADGTFAPVPEPIQRMVTALRGTQNTIVVEGYANAEDGDKNAASLDRANRLRDQLVQNGVDARQVTVVAKGEQAGRAGGARVVETQATDNKAGAQQAQRAQQTQSATPAANATTTSGEPIGTSHFESTTTMSVPRGTSAMVSILRSSTDGEVVYLFDPESARGNAQYPFKAVRFKNPTDSALESGPVTVFGDGRFVGEGLAEPIPAHAVAFVPFALDRQIVVERKDAERDDIARIITVQRGVFSTQIQHTRKATFTLYNRLPEKASVYLRHTVTPGYRLSRSPEASPDTPLKTTDSERLQGAHLFRVELEPNGRADVVIEEATPVMRTTDIRTTEGLDLVRAYLSNAAFDGPLKGEIEKLLKLNADLHEGGATDRDHARADDRVPTAHGRAACAARDAEAGEDRGAAHDASREEAAGDLGAALEGDGGGRLAPGEADDRAHPVPDWGRRSVARVEGQPRRGEVSYSPRAARLGQCRSRRDPELLRDPRSR